MLETHQGGFIWMTRDKKKKQPESSDADDSFDYDQGFNIEEVYDQ